MSRHKTSLESRQRWMRSRNDTDTARSNVSHAERHYTPSELAELWGVSVDWVRRRFRDEQGVLKIGTLRVRLRIPESVAARVHGELS